VVVLAPLVVLLVVEGLAAFTRRVGAALTTERGAKAVVVPPPVIAVGVARLRGFIMGGRGVLVLVVDGVGLLTRKEAGIKATNSFATGAGFAGPMTGASLVVGVGVEVVALGGRAGAVVLGGG